MLNFVRGTSLLVPSWLVTDFGTVVFVFVSSLLGFGVLGWYAVDSRHARQSRRLETMLLNSKSILRSDVSLDLIAELEPACVKVLDEDCRILAVNQGCLDFLDAPSAEPFLGKYAPTFLKPADRKLYVDAIRRAAAGETTELEYEFVSINGRRRWVRQRAKRLVSSTMGQKAQVLCLSREVTQGKLVKERLDEAFAVTGQALWDEWIQTGEIYYNDNWFTMLGYEPGEMPSTASTWHTLLHPDDLKRARAEFERHKAEGTTGYTCDYRMRTKSGEWKWIRDIGRVVERSDSGVPIRAIGVHIDIDRAKRLEIALSSIVSFRSTDSGESVLEHICRTLTEAFSVDMSYISRFSDMLDSNATIIAGWSSEGVVGEITYALTGTPCERTMLSDFCHFQSKVCELFPEDHLLAKLAAESYTGVVLRSSDNEPIGLLILLDSRARPASPELESMLRLIATRAAAELERFQIESELHRTRERLLSFADRLETATTGAGLGVFEYRFETGEMIWDETMHELYGTGGMSIVPSTELWESRIHPDDLPRMRGMHERILGGLERIESSFRVLPGGDAVRHISVAATVKRAPDGTPLTLTGVNWDITDSVRTNKELIEAKELAESASSAKSEFLANMSHEIRTPLTAIIGYTELLAGDEGFAHDPEQLDSSLRSIQTNAQHLLVILNDILDLSKIHAGMMQVESLELCPATLIRESVTMLAARAKAKGIELSVEFLTELPSTVYSDPTRIRQILLNLIGNAVKFTEVGGVSVGVAYQPLPDLTGMLTLSIRDTGIGIAPEHLEFLENFDPFTQADGSTTRRFGGTGLGLRLTDAFARKLGGQLKIASELGKGSTFTVTLRVLPAADQSMHLPESIRPSAESPNGGAVKLRRDGLEGQRIMLVEDGPDNQRLLSYMLSKAGAEALLACNGREAVELIRELLRSGTTIDLALMDMQMPEVDGYSATGMLRELGYRGPIVALTAHAMEGDRARCLAAGCQDYLTKPVSSKRLVETCIQWLGWRWRVSRAA